MRARVPDPRVVKIPRRIIVGPFVYKVSDDPVDLVIRCREESTDLLGHNSQRELIITIDPAQAPGQRRDSLLHETLHAVTQLTGLASEWGQETEEAIVNRLSPVVLSVLRDNPRLLRYLTEP